jgi:hypothetical protein|tara:strand:+ start:166 stop:549 length:384 start_codon:yes stop_codon:yes gene_type:complete
MTWVTEKRKQGAEIWVTSSTGLNGQLALKTEAIFIGDCYNAKEEKRSHFLADIIVEALNKADDKRQDDKNREGWVCIHCGESTYDNDTEQLFSAIEHIGCALKAEAKAEGKAAKAIRLGNEVTDEEV